MLFKNLDEIFQKVFELELHKTQMRKKLKSNLNSSRMADINRTLNMTLTQTDQPDSTKLSIKELKTDRNGVQEQGLLTKDEYLKKFFDTAAKPIYSEQPDLLTENVETVNTDSDMSGKSSPKGLLTSRSGADSP